MSFTYSKNQMGGRPLRDLGVFRDIKSSLASSDGANAKGLSRNKNDGGRSSAGGRMGMERRGDRVECVLPLSAYNAFEEVPFHVSGKSFRNGKIDELAMKEERLRRQRKEIRYLGWNQIQSVGFNKTMQQLEDERREMIQMQQQERREQLEQERLGQQHDQRESMMISAVQENIDYEGQSFHDLNVAPITSAVDQVDGGAVSEEDEISYDYDAEYARVEDDDDEQVPEQPENYMMSMQNRNLTRGLSIQQFVETSHIQNHPYDIEDEDDDVESDNDQFRNVSASRDYPPGLSPDISDPVDTNDRNRISSLASVGRVMTIEQFERSMNQNTNSRQPTS